MLHTRTSVDYMARLPQPSPQASHFWLGGARGAPSLCYQMKIRYPEVPVLSLPLPTKSPLHARACCAGAAQASAQISAKKKRIPSFLPAKMCSASLHSRACSIWRPGPFLTSRASLV